MQILHHAPLRSRYRGAPRAVAFIYFALLVLPVFFFGAGMTTDFTLIITANRQAASATQSAAIAGAQQYSMSAAGGSATLDPNMARKAAAETFCVNRDASAISGVQPLETAGGTRYPCASGGAVYLDIKVGDVAAYQGVSGPTSVTVTAHYRVPRLIFSNLLGGGTTTKALTVTRTASLCLPGQTDNNRPLSGGTNGFCARP